MRLHRRRHLLCAAAHRSDRPGTRAAAGACRVGRDADTGGLWPRPFAGRAHGGCLRESPPGCLGAVRRDSGALRHRDRGFRRDVSILVNRRGRLRRGNASTPAVCVPSHAGGIARPGGRSGDGRPPGRNHAGASVFKLRGCPVRLAHGLHHLRRDPARAHGRSAATFAGAPSGRRHEIPRNPRFDDRPRVAHPGAAPTWAL